MTQYRLVAADLDGTLLDANGDVTPATAAIVAALRDAGAVLALATSRRLAGASPIAARLALRGPLILYDGAQVRDYPDGRILATDPLDAAVAQRVVEVMADHSLRPIVQHAEAEKEYLVVGPAVPGHEQEQQYLARFADQISVAPLRRLCADRADPLRLVVFGPLRALRETARELAALPCGWQLLPHGNYGTAELSVFSPTASKGHALALLARSMGVALHETAAIGDGINDVSMLAMAGLSIAMANGNRRTRAVANVIAPPHTEDGAARALATHVLGWPAGARLDAGESVVAAGQTAR